MDFFQHRYYTLAKTLMSLIGQWPYQSIRAKLGFLAIAIVFNTTQITPLIAAFKKHRGDQIILLDCFIAFIFVTICITKLTCFMWNSHTILRLVNRIRTDWQVWARDPEVDILHEYAEQGKKAIFMYTDLSILCTAMIYSSLLIFMAEPVVPKIIDLLLMNGTEPGRFPFPVEYYYFNTQKYYFYIIMYSSLYTCVMCTVLIASDVMLIVYVQHACGIFAALGHKLERIGSNVTSAETSETQCALDKRDIVHITSCIDRHNDAIEYAKLIEAVYTWAFVILVGIGMILMNVIGLQVLVRKSDPLSTIRLIVFGLSSTVLFAIMNHLSQILMDHSDGIHWHVCNSQWYRVSPKAQKLLKFMIMRCSVPCRLTIGTFFIMGMRTFGMTVRTTVSYFMIVRSMQQL